MTRKIKSARTTGPSPFGYLRQRGRLNLDPRESLIRQSVFELFIVERKKQSVAEILNAEGHRTRSGTPFSTQTIGRILVDPIVLGVPGEIDQIVEPELFRRCQDILAAQKSAGGAKRSARHLFAGLLFCSCGQKMYVPSSSRKYVCSDCRSKVIASDLETVFIQQLKTNKPNLALSSLLENWNTLPFETKRETIEALCERIDARDKSLTIHFADL